MLEKMKIKPKFKPVITRIKLNPEQAVLACCSITGGKGQINTANRNQCATRAGSTCNTARRNQLTLS
jgi:hypothetical protein